MRDSWRDRFASLKSTIWTVALISSLRSAMRRSTAAMRSSMKERSSSNMPPRLADAAWRAGFFLGVPALPAMTSLLCRDAKNGARRERLSRRMLKAALNPGLARPQGSFRQRDELAVADHRDEPAGLPIGLGRLDPLRRARDEIPPDMARPIHGRAAEQHEPGTLSGGQDDVDAGTEDQQLAGRMRLAGELDRALDQERAALLVPPRQRQPRTRIEQDVGIEHVGEGAHRSASAEQLAGDEAQARALALDHRQRSPGMMGEIGRGLLVVLGQGDPGLDAEEPRLL